ncbi:MAG: prolyl oligopeptidase family serine peptidase [Rubripirellula sp.]|nr:prolyl oligopeptidase family serine peptidase [Rubripirellula sp.]
MTAVQPSNLRTYGIQSLFGAISLFILTSYVSGQDISLQKLDHQDYDLWNTISRNAISNDGSWVMYTVQIGAIDGEVTLRIYNTGTDRKYTVPRATGAMFTADSRHVVFRVTPEKAKLKAMRTDKQNEQSLPKPKLQYLELKTGNLLTLENNRSYKIPADNGNWLACLMERPSGPNELESRKSSATEVYEVTNEGLRQPTKPLELKSREALARQRGEREEAQEPAKQSNGDQKKADTKKEDKKEEEKTTGTPLILVNLKTGVQRTFPSVISYAFSKTGETLAFSTSVNKADTHQTDIAAKGKDSDVQKRGDKAGEKQKMSVDGVHVIKLNSLEHITIATGPGEYKNMTFSNDGTQLAFITNKDDYESKTATWAVYHWTSRAKVAKSIAKEGDKGIHTGWWVSPRSSQRFSEDAKRLYFDTTPVPEEVSKERSAQKTETVDEKDEDKKAKLDLWHWQDPQLQPQQLLQAETERNRNYRAAYIFKTKRFVQLASRQIPGISVDYRSPSDLAVAVTNMRYRRMLSWDVPGYQDIYLINLNTGARNIVLEKVKWKASMSPEGKYITWFDAERKQWFAKKTADTKGAAVQISKGIKFPLQDELHDTPNLARAYGEAGWLTNDHAFLIYDRYDIWQLDPTGKIAPICVTGGTGRKRDIRFRYRSLDSEQRAVDPNHPIILTAFNRKTKASGFYSLNFQQLVANKKPVEGKTLRRLIMLDENIGSLKKAKDSDQLVFTRSTFRRCPDLWTSTVNFKSISRVSDINPQQQKYSWGTSELVHWKANDGQRLDGILLKPDNFDPDRKYPMLVYFYERNSDNLHRYYTPAAGRSIICHSFYVSRGYLVFIPDIPYETGKPGSSAVNAILPGVEHIARQGFVDKNRIGIQGHSWGGYQTAFLVTQTNMFACAESGAPVSNMTSAYGGIRWGSGMSRMFQYERTQSRIGDDLWSARDKYIANSPLFFADKINTPLLILHNDEDGAVPWYQGIELFVALRRLGRPAWMLNYNGEPHWVMNDYNRRDFAIRMQQFFDHYLKNAPEPEWMAVGIAAVEKGENYGLELLEPKEANQN